MAIKPEAFGLGDAEQKILFCVTGWFNGFALEIHGQEQRIGTHHEPTLRQLCQAVNRWGEEYDEVHESMQSRGLFKSAEREEDIYLAGRRCEWIPTLNCMKIIDRVFQEAEQLHPSWARDELTGPPTFRDGPELMEHRKGVMVATQSLRKLKPDYHCERYPRVNSPERPDSLLWGTQAKPLAQIEVLTEHGNSDTWEQKFRAWGPDQPWPTIWLFENRPAMIKFWNHLVRNGLIELDGGRFDGRTREKKKRWSPVRVNDRLDRSRDGPQDYESHDVCWTIPGMLQADIVEINEWAKERNII